MISDLTSFAAQLRELMAFATCSKPSPGLSAQAFLDERFSTLAMELFALQFKHNSVYRRICEARGQAPDTVESWSKIPAAPAAAFKEFELTSLAPAERVAVFHSSGTMGQQRSRHFHSQESLKLYEASLWPWFEKHVIPDLSSTPWHFLSLTPNKETAPNSSLVHMIETTSRLSRARTVTFAGYAAEDGTWGVDVELALEVVAGVVEGPVVLLGTAFNFVHLLDAMVERRQRLRLSAGSRIMETGGYKGRSRELAKPELHALLTEYLGVPQSQILSEYGMSELGSQAYDSVSGGLCKMQHATRIFRFPPWCRVQITSPETGREVADGETGLVRIYDLANAFSVMGIQTEDKAVRHGHGFELIGRAVAAEPRGCSLMAI